MNFGLTELIKTNLDQICLSSTEEKAFYGAMKMMQLFHNGCNGRGFMSLNLVMGT